LANWSDECAIPTPRTILGFEKKMTQNKKVVSFGEVMMRLSPPPYQRFTQANQFEINYGGSEANVSVSLAGFGISAEHVTCFPQNDFGKAANSHLQSHGVATQHVVVADGRMGLYFIEHGAAHRSSKVIYDRFDSAFANLNPSMFDWEEILTGANWFHWCGITPAISQGTADACYQAIRTARKLGVKISADINYRRNLWQYGKTAMEVMQAMIGESDIVIGGLADFENCMGIQVTDFEEACKKIKKKFPNVLKIANTERESVHSSHNKISSMMWNGKTVIHSKEYELNPIVDRVGSGDAFMAGLVYGWLTGKSDEDTLEFAIAACALKHTVPGDVNRVSVEEVNDLVKGVNIGKLLR
jgi:2-dehydro-3-deoxygluconokinase